MKTKKRLRTIVRRLIAMLIAVVMCITSGDGMGRVYAQTEEVGRPDSGKLVRYLTLSVKDVTTGEVIVENGTPTGNRVNENDDVKIMFEFLIGEMDTIEKDENGNYLTFATEVNTSGGRLKETGSDYLPDTGNSNRDMGDWSLSSDGKLAVNINDKGADSTAEQGNGYVFLKGTGKSIWVTWEGKLDFSGVEDAETGEGMIDVIVAGEKTAVPVNLDDNKVSVSKKITQKDGNDVYYDKKSGKYFVDYQINVKTDKGYAFIDSIDDEAGTTIGDDFYNLQISLKTAYGSVSKIEGATLADLNTAIRTDEELIITYSREVKPDFLNGSDKYYDSDGSRTNKAIVHGITNHGTKVSPESSPVIYSNASPGIGKEGKYEDGKINWTCYIEIPKDSGIKVKSIEDKISHTITPDTAADGNIGAAPANIKNIANWNKVSDNPIRYEYSYSTDVSELLLEEKNIKAALIKNELDVVFKDQNGEEVTRHIAPVVEVNPGPGETIHTSKATVQKTFEEYNKFKQVSAKYRLLKWEITVTTPSEEDWNDLSYIDLVDDPETWQHHYLARRVELEDGTLLYSDSGFNRGQSSNTGYFTDEGKKYFDTSLAEADKTQYPFDINNGCLKLRLKKDNLSPEKDYTFVVYTRVTDDSKLSTRSFKNGVKVSTIYKDTLQVEEDKDSAESGVLKTTEKYGEATGKAGEVEYTVTFNLGAYAKNLRMQNRTLYPNDKIVFYDEIKNGYLEYVPDSAYLSCDLLQSEYYKIPYTEFTGNLEVSTDGGKTTFTYTMTDELMKLFDHTTGTFTYHGSQFNPILKINYLAKLTDEEARELTLSEEKENQYSNEVKVSYNGVVVGQDTEDIFLTANKVLDKQYVHQGAKLTYTVTVNPDAVKFNDDGSRLYAKDVAGANLRIIKNSIKVSDENGELEIGSGKNQYDYKIEKDQNGDNVLKFNIPDGKALTITYSALIDVAGNIIQPTDRVANTFYLYKHEDVMEIDRVSNSIESGDFVQDSGGSSARATVGLSKVWFDGQKYVSLNDCRFELYECRVKDDIVLVGDRVSFSKDNNIYMVDIDGTESDISISEEGVTLKELDYAKLYLLHETEAPNPLNKTDYYFIVSNDSGNDATLKISDEEYESKYKNVTDEDGNSLEIHKYKDSNAQFEIEDFVEFELDAKKTVKYTDGSEAPMGTYAFKIEEVDVNLADAEVIENGYSAIATNDEEGNIEFDPIRVNMTQDEEYYYYKVTEYTAELPDDVIGDDTYYIITMHVKRQDNGEFTHDLVYTKYERDGKDSEYSESYVNADDIKFKNVVESNDNGSLEISKSVYVDGNDRTNTYKDKAYSFTVQDKDKNYYDTDGTKTSDEKIISVYPGEVVTVSGLKPGKYTIKEKTDDLNLANYKYVGLTTNPEDGVVDVVKNEIAKYEAKNDYETKTTSVKIIKTDAADLEARIGGAEFTLTGSTLDTPVVKTTLEATGQLQFDGLLYGATYELAETKAPEGYRVSESSPWTISVADNGVITITDKDGKESTYTSAGYKIADEKKKSELIVTKTFSGDISDDEKDKVSFQIYAENGDKLADFTYAEMDNGSKSFNLNPGKYTVKETTETVDGYTLTRTYTVDSSVNTKDVSKTSYTDAGVAVEIDDKESVTVAFKNDYVKDTGNLKITKKFINIDDNSSIDISKLTDAEKAKVIFEIEGPDSYDEIITLKDFSSDLTYTFENIPVGEYTITEDNQLTDTKEYIFVDYVVSYKDGESEIEPDFNKVNVTKDSTTEVTVTNAYEKKVALLAVSKTFEGNVSEADKNKVLFEIYDNSNILIAGFTYEDMESGVKRLEVLPGTYTVKEVAKDINGTTISKSYKVESSDSDHNTSGAYTADGVTVTVANKEKAEVAFNNKYVRDSGKLEITKAFVNGDEKVDISSLTDEEKAAVKFTITGPDDYKTKTISLLDFDSDMKYLETGVPTGDYTVTETGADAVGIDGYTFSESVKVITKDGEVQTGTTAMVTRDETTNVAFTSKYEEEKTSLKITKNFVCGDESLDISSMSEEDKKNIKFTIKGPEKYGTKTVTLADFDENLTYVEKDIPVGDYTVTEAGADSVSFDGYTFSESVKVVTEDGEVQFTSKYAEEEKTTSLKITKSFVCGDESLDSSKLSEDDKKNIKFTITGPEKYGTKVVTLADFDENLTYVEKDIPVGDYTVTEAGADSVSFDGYTFSESVKVVTEDGEVHFTSKYAEEEKTTSLKITKSFVCGDESLDISKLSEDDKKNIKFTITGPEKYGTKVVTLADFDENLTYVEKDIPVGDYTVTEAGADKVGFDGYTFSESVKNVTEDGEVQFTSKYAEEEKTTSLKITKSFVCGDEDLDISSMSEEDKKNIKFTIKGPEKYGTKVVTLADFDENLTYVEKDIPVGEYTVTEAGAESVSFDGYTFSESVKVVTEDGVVQFTSKYAEEEKTTSLKITKSFVCGDESLDISKLSEADKKNIKFTIKGPEKYGTKVVTLADFDENFTYEESGIPVGDYTVTEAGADSVNFDGYTFSESVKNITQDGVVQFTSKYAEEEKTTSLKITKSFVCGDKSLDASSMTEADKKNIKFTITGPEKYGTKVVTLADFDENLTYVEKDIPVGEYTVTEAGAESVSFDGYTFSESVKVVTEDGVVQFTSKYAEEEKTTSLKITKSFVCGDEDLDISSMSDEDKKTIKFTIKGPEKYGTKVVTLADFDENLTYVEKDIPVGEYTVTEAGAESVSFDGYTFSESVKVVTEDGVVQFTSKYAEEEKTTSLKITKSFVCGDESLDISKLSEADKKNIKFTITGPEKYGTKVVTLVDFDENYTYVEKDIPVGDYTVTETGADKVNIDGYTFSESVKNVTEDGEVQFTSKYEEDKTSLKITKSFVCGDEDLDISLMSEEDKKNIKFTIKGPEKYGTKVVTLADFDENLTYVEKDIPVGDYTVTETGADKVNIDGYTFSESVKNVTEDGEVQFTSKYEEDKTSLKITKSFVCGDENLDISLMSEEDKKNIKFTIKGPEKYGTKVVTLADFDENLTYVEKDIPVGEYTVTEAGADKVRFDGYTFGESVKNVTEDGEVHFTSKYAEEEKTTSLKITKSFVCGDESLDISKLSEADKKNIKFTIKGPEKYGTKVVTLADFDENFTYEESGIPVGEYTVTESGADSVSFDGYTFSESVKVVTEDGVVQFTSKYAEEEKTTSLKITKSFVCGDESLDISKLSEADKKNIKFTITGPEKYGTKVVTLADFDENFTYEESGIPVGEYTVTESGTDSVSFDGYTFSESVKNITEDGEVQFTSKYDKIIVKEERGTIKIAASFNVEGEPYDIAAISSADKEAVTFRIYGPESFGTNGIREITLNDFVSGVYTEENVPAGLYYIAELSCPVEIPGASIDDVSVRLKGGNEIPYGGEKLTDGRIVEFEVTNSYKKNIIIEGYGYLTIRNNVVVDNTATGAEADSNLNGKTFKITVKDADGRYVCNEVDSDGMAILTTDKSEAVISLRDGEVVTLGKLKLGTYTVEEDKVDAIAGNSDISGKTLEDRYVLDVKGIGSVDITIGVATASDATATDAADAAKVEIVNTYVERKLEKPEPSDTDPQPGENTGEQKPQHEVNTGEQKPQPGVNTGGQKPQPDVNAGEQKPQSEVNAGEQKPQSDTYTAESKKRDDKPATGDDFPAIPVAGLLLASLTGVYVVGKKKEKRR